MSGRGRVVVVGSLNGDFVMTVEHLPSEGQTVGGDDFARHWGGKGANQAAVAATYGAEVTMLGAVGEDDLGRGARHDLAQRGVDVDRVVVRPGRSTGAAMVLVDRDGRNVVAVTLGANLSLTAEDVSRTPAVREAEVVLTCFEVGQAAVVAAVEAARERDAVAVVNPAPARALPPSLRGSGVLLTPNEHEVLELLDGGRDDDPVAAGQRLAAWTGGPVVITLGERGAVVCRTDADPVRLPAPRVDVRDTTGAGDAFNGVLAACLAQGLDLHPAVLRALAGASLSVTGLGARGHLPTRAEVEDAVTGGPVVADPDSSAGD